MITTFLILYMLGIAFFGPIFGHGEKQKDLPFAMLAALLWPFTLIGGCIMMVTSK
ncbi:hypothetical protein PMW_12 [Pseudomonas phage phiPMW]|uniref:Uncharacterized protein n=1 Tax=Pseudomonas phage phiPMW TaxID=1815582 RepID=A0A1S5R184_9CAUD|nr:hypothetical protein FDG97_gp012 [Pseudomonas phage phiPMW]ANA49137.1 hypothetical protein PMW_12 [Pseudomonas phage phiPMW]